MKHNYVGFAKQGDTFGPAVGKGDYTPHLPAGHYRVSYNRYEDELHLTKFSPKMDEILNLGCVEFNEAVDMTRRFLLPETETAFQKAGFLLKRSFLFYGPPGTGKSVLSAQVAELTVQHKNAIAIYPESFQALERMLQVLDQTDPTRFKTISLEEFDGLVAGNNEASWTTLLDGQFQSANRLLVATTNNIHQIPKRLLRPGRFSSLVLIPSLDAAARSNFLKSKSVPESIRNQIVEQTNGFTVDDLKEVVQLTMLLGEGVNKAITKIKLAKTLGGVEPDDEPDTRAEIDEDGMLED